MSKEVTARTKVRSTVPRLSDFPVTLEVGVRWGDMDAMGHVNNASFFRYFESARIAYFERVGLGDPARRSGPVPILVSTRCDFVKPVYYPDQAVVGASVREVRTTSLTMDHAVYKGAHRDLCASGSAVLVFYDYSNKAKMPIPSDMRARIEQIEKGLGRPARP